MQQGKKRTDVSLALIAIGAQIAADKAGEVPVLFANNDQSNR
jgi:hypothetical protein